LPEAESEIPHAIARYRDKNSGRHSGTDLSRRNGSTVLADLSAEALAKAEVLGEGGLIKQ